MQYSPALRMSFTSQTLFQVLVLCLRNSDAVVGITAKGV